MGCLIFNLPHCRIIVSFAIEDIASDKVEG